MYLLQHLPSALLAFLALSDTASAAKKPTNGVLLTDVKTLTLRHGLKTSAHRVSAIPQARLIHIWPIYLSCVGGSAKGLYDVDVMRCRNAGTDYDENNVQWTCTAALPPEFKLGSTDVVCEGYDSPDDPYILKGSCGVEYRLVLTDAGEEKYGRGRPSGIYRASADEEGGLGGLAQGVFWLLFAGVAVWMMYSVWRSRGARRQPGARSNWGGGGGGPGDGGGDDYDAPPPYTPRHPKSYPPSSSQRTGGGWWSGAATGAAAGAAAAYMAANRNNNNTNSANTAARNQRSGGFWGGGSNEAGPSGGRRSQGDGGSGWGGSGSGGSGGGARHESTGFGSSRRR